MDYTYNIDDAILLANATTVIDGQRVRLTNDGQFVANRMIQNGDVFTISEAIDTLAAERPALFIPVDRH